MNLSKNSVPTLKTSSLLLLVMTTVSVAQIGDIPLQTESFHLQTRKGLTHRPVISEKIGVKKDGSKLIISIVGASGRYCGVFYKTSDAEQYHLERGSIKRIERAGEIEITMDLKQQDHGTLIFQVFTAADSDFKNLVRGTSVFEVSMLHRKIVSVSRNGGLQVSDKVASKAATVGYTDRKEVACATVVGIRSTVRKDISMPGIGGMSGNKVYRKR